MYWSTKRSKNKQKQHKKSTTNAEKWSINQLKLTNLGLQASLSVYTGESSLYSETPEAPAHTGRYPGRTLRVEDVTLS